MVYCFHGKVKKNEESNQSIWSSSLDTSNSLEHKTEFEILDFELFSAMLKSR